MRSLSCSSIPSSCPRCWPTRLTPDVIEEVLRFESPVQVATTRFTAEPISIAGQQIPAGAMVFRPCWRPAGIDGTSIAAIHSSWVAVSTGMLTFGYGIHYCLGAQLARVEAAVALRRLLARFPAGSWPSPSPR